MASQGQVVSINGHTLAAGAMTGVTGEVIESSASPSASPQFLDRNGLPPEFSGSGVDANAIDVSFKVSDWSAKSAVLAAIDYPNTNEPLELQAYWGNPDSPTLCTADVAVRQLAISPGQVLASFDRAEAAWRAVTLASLGRTLNFDSSNVATLINKGHVRAAPYFKLGWSIQRTAFTAAVGWRFRYQVTITNNTTEDWEDELMTVDAGATDAWVTASEAQADGDDVRVWFRGREVYRTLTCFNTKRTLIHFLVSLKAGASATYDIVCGNSAATAPRNLSTRTATRKTYAAPDLEGYSGTATAGAVGTLTDGGAAWETDRWKDGWIGIVSGTGSGRWRRIAGNTGTVITFNRVLVTAPDATSKYVIFKSGIFFDGGRVTGGVTSTAFQDTAHTRKWGVNQLKGATITFIGGSGATPSVVTVASNTADTITTVETFTVNPAINDQFTIQRQGVWSYVVDTAITETLHRGVYRQNTYYSKPTRAWPNGDTPAGWQVETFLPNNDLYAAYPSYSTGAGGGHAVNYWSIPRSERRVSQDRRLPGSGTGDGWSLFSAIGFQGWYLDYQAQNMSGIGMIAFATMDVGGQDWQFVVTDSTTRAALTDVAAQYIDLSDYSNPTRLYMGCLPSNGEDIVTTSPITNIVALRTNNVLEVHHYLSAFGGLSSSIYSLGSKTECYELACTLRIGGGREAERTPPFEEIVIGGAGHRVILPANYALWIATDPAPGTPLFGVYNSTYVLQYESAWAGLIDHHIPAADGTDLAIQSHEFSPVPPAINMISNGYFGANVTGWTAVNSAGVTAATTWKATPDAGDGIGTGSMETDITAAPAGAWTITITWPQIAVVPGRNYPIGFAYRATNIGSSLSVVCNAVWEGGTGADPTTVLGGAPAAINTWYYAAEDEYTFKVEPGLVSAYSSTDTVDISIVISGTGSYVGKIYVDQITLGVANVHCLQTGGGRTTLQVSWQEGYLS